MTRLSSENYQSAKYELQKNGELAYRLVPALADRSITGLPKVSVPWGEFKIEDFRLPGHDGQAVLIVGNEAEVDKYRQRGAKIWLMYYNNGSLETIKLFE